MKGNLKTNIFLIITAFLWGINPIPMKIALQEFDMIPFTFLRVFAGFITVFIFLLFTRDKKKIEWRDKLLLLRIGVLGFFIFQFNYTIGVKYTSASISAIILATMPVFVLIINFITRTERLSARLVIGVVLSLFGVFLISAGSSNGFTIKGTYFTGIILLVIGEVAYAYYMVNSKILINKYTAGQVLFSIISISLVLFIFIYIPRFSISDFTGISIQAWLGVIFSGAFSMSAANILWYYGIKQIGTSRTSVFGNLPPVFGIIAAFIFLDESLVLIQIAGGIIIAAGIYFVNRKKV